MRRSLLHHREELPRHTITGKRPRPRHARPAVNDPEPTESVEPQVGFVTERPDGWHPEMRFFREAPRRTPVRPRRDGAQVGAFLRTPAGWL
jgi:hypothetical protein